MKYALQMKKIEKSFGTNKVLHGVDLSVQKGSIHALLGENGTGKTTLMNILGGVLTKDSGEIFINGEKCFIKTPNDATTKGIAFIHQELTLINDLTVYENFFIGYEPTKKGFMDVRTMCEKSQEVLGRIGVNIDPKVYVRNLNPSEKQIVEIARALLKNACIIIMDEPTSSLTNAEIEKVFAIMRSLREDGVSFIFISHKLGEVMDICDSYTVFRNGELVDTGLTCNSCEADIVKHMVGRVVDAQNIYRPREQGEILLELKNLSDQKHFKNVSLTVKKGEIIGITGLLGDGRSELMETVYGNNPGYNGQIYWQGEPVQMKSCEQALNMGISYVASNRKENGIIKDLSISHNMVLPVFNKLCKRNIIDKKALEQSNARFKELFQIKIHDLNLLITTLSGGNQQKVMLAKALGSEPQLIILDNPTQGVDVGTKFEIYNIILDLAEKGVSFVVLTSEVPEILRLADRIYVMYHGEIRKEFTDRSEATEESVMYVATGG